MLYWKKGQSPLRYYESADGEIYMAWSTCIGDNLRMTLGKELPAGSPPYEREGAFEFATLDEKSRWVAPTHCVFFPGKNVVGIIFSQEGPRTSPLLQYLKRKVGIEEDIALEVITRDDIEAELRKIKSVRKIQLQYHPSLRPSLFHAQHDDLDALMNAFANMREAAIVKIEISVGKKQGASLSNLRDNLISLIKRRPFYGQATKFEVSGPRQTTNRNYPIDLLTSELSASETVALTPGAKHLDRDAAYRAIEGAYGERLNEFPSVEIKDD